MRGRCLSILPCLNIKTQRHCGSVLGVDHEIRGASMGAYQDQFDRSLSDPAGFWAEVAEQIDWIERWDRVLVPDAPNSHRWFVGGVMNTCYNAVDRHVENGRGSQVALTYDSPVTGTIKSYP